MQPCEREKEEEEEEENRKKGGEGNGDEVERERESGGEKKEDVRHEQEGEEKEKKNEDDEKEEAEGPSLVKCTLQGLCITCRLQSFTLLFRLLARSCSALVPTSSSSSSLSLGDIVFNMIGVVCLGNIEPYLRKLL